MRHLQVSSLCPFEVLNRKKDPSNLRLDPLSQAAVVIMPVTHVSETCRPKRHTGRVIGVTTVVLVEELFTTKYMRSCAIS